MLVTVLVLALANGAQRVPGLRLRLEGHRLWAPRPQADRGSGAVEVALAASVGPAVKVPLRIAASCPGIAASCPRAGPDTGELPPERAPLARSLATGGLGSCPVGQMPLQKL